MKKIIISGGNGNLPQKIIRNNKKYNLVPLNKDEMNVSNIESVESNIRKEKPDYFIHSGALTRPMSLHNDYPSLSIKSNIIGTANVVMVCQKYNVKLIYISTDCVYEGANGNYSECDAVKPFNKYGWSKLGGECSVMLYPNSLILRLGMLTSPFPHNSALVDMKKSLMDNDKISQVILSLIDERGIFNVGGKSQSVYDFISKKHPTIKKGYLKDVVDVEMPKDCSMNTEKMKKKLNEF